MMSKETALSKDREEDLYVETEDIVEVIIPTLNEGATLGDVLRRTRKYSNKVVVVDGRSSDNTVVIARKLGAQVILQNGIGKGAAMREAFDLCEGDVIVVMDADGSMRPEEIPIFLKEISSGADIAKGSRFLAGGRSEDITFLRRFGNSVFVALVNMIFGSDFTDICYGYIVFRKDALKKLASNLKSDGFSIETEIIIKAKKLGLRIVEVPSLELKRSFGNSKLNTFRDGWRILSTILKSALT